jgi:hypothetical protein
MVNVHGMARLGVLAVGLGIGAAVAHMPVASADSSTDWLSSVDGLLGGALPAPAASGLDLDISVDGYQLLDLGSGATATAGTGDFAIAFGAGSTATAVGGYGDYASASGGGTAIAGDPTSSATGNNFDSATANGFDSTAWSGNGGSLGFPDTIGSSFDSASANSGSATGTEGANAYAGFNGSGDSASALGQGAASYAGFSSNAAGPANYDSASVVGNLTTPTQDLAIAGSSTGTAGSSDTAFIFDPVGTVGSSAIAGEGFNSDLAGVFGDALHASATTASNLVDILPSL